MNKTAYIFALMLFVSMAGVLAGATGTTAEVVTGGTTATITFTSNETQKASYYVSTDSGVAAPYVTSGSIGANASSASIKLTGLTPETTYYYKFNGTSQVTDAAWTTAADSFVTDNYTLTGVVRTIMALLVLIVVGGGTILAIKRGHTATWTARDWVITLALLLMCAYFLNEWVLTILSLS